jgi:peptidoglycan/LPS O-acetylase OafA/YrhL
MSVASPSRMPMRAEGSTLRLRGVDGFRALAVLAVLVYHNWLYTTAGRGPAELGYLSRFVLPHLSAGVTLFFVLSGFLLYRPIVSRVLNGQQLQTLRNYLRNRALRIFPAYWVILFVTAVVLPATLIRASTSDLQLGRLIGQPTVLLRNATLTQNYFAGSMDTGIAPAWSLAVEIVFYLVLPFLGILAASMAARAVRRPGRTVAVVVPPLLLIGLGIVAVRVWEAVLPLDGAAYAIFVRSFPNHADLFAFGMILAVIMVSIEDGAFDLPSWWRIPTYAVLATLVCATVVLVDRGLILTFKGAVPYELLTALSAALLLAIVVLPSTDGSVSVVTRILDTPILGALGLVSYSLFLWHEPLQRLADQRGLTFGGATGFWVNLLFLGLVSAALATLTYRFVERPALDRKRRDTRSGSERERREDDGSSGAETSQFQP